MQDQQYDGVVLEDKWGKSYLCSSCLLAYADLGEDSLGDVKDTEFGRYFLHDLEPSWDQRNIWTRLYQHARPWATDLSKLNKFQLRDALLQMFARDEMRIWQLTDGWGKAPEGNGIGDGGLAPAASGSTSPAPAAKASKPKGGGATADQPVAAKTAAHEAKSTPVSVIAVTSKAADVSEAKSYMTLVSDFTELSKDEIVSFYAEMEAIGVDYKPLIQNAMDKHGLTLDEAHAVFGYTTKLFYRDLNQSLLAGGKDSATALSKLVSSGIEKMPDSGNTQFRGWRLETAVQQGSDPHSIATLPGNDNKPARHNDYHNQHSLHGTHHKRQHRRPDHGGCPAVDADLGVKRGDVIADRVFGQVEGITHFSIAQALADQREDFGLPF